MLILKIIMFIMVINVSHQQTTEEYCGQYGFRCVDLDTFQICTYPDLDGQTEAPEPVHKCYDHNVCDEDNPAYCTPLDPLEDEFKPKSKEKSEKKIFAKRGQTIQMSQNPTDYSYDRKRHGKSLKNNRNFNDNLKLRNIFDFNNEDEDEVETTTTATDNEYEQPTFQNQNFECEHFGYFPDVANASMFWNCDHQFSGKGYIVRHMLCSPGRVFDPIHKECVIVGTTRNTRNDRIYNLEPSTELKNESKKKRKSTKMFGNQLNFDVKFSCRKRLPGKYADEFNCRIYHYCLPRSFAPFNQLTFVCPDHLTYDDERETCNRLSSYRCIEMNQQNGKLHIEIDAIVLQKRKCKNDLRHHDPADCSGYHLCYNDEVLHMKCPDSYHFNENLLSCQPQHLVACGYQS